MLRNVMIVLYTGLLLGANMAHADVAAAQAALAGDMRKLAFLDSPKPLPEVGMQDLDGTDRSLAEWQGRWVVLNFWATWCAPCRKEMPSLERLSTAYTDSNIAVVTVATGRNPPPAIKRFFTEIGVENLPVLLDPKSVLARQMGVLGLPLTVILNPEGQEVARLIGDAEWDAEDAHAMLTALTRD